MEYTDFEKWLVKKLNYFYDFESQLFFNRKTSKTVCNEIGIINISRNDLNTVSALLRKINVPHERNGKGRFFKMPEKIK